jgi:MinD superfamily P-loop ATPase
VNIAIASGKGGTGKTTVAVNLAQVISGPVQLLDCDVEEPNCALFLSPKIEESETVGIPIPQVDEALCTACGECGKFCEFNAIISFKTTPLVFPELCHGCGGCLKVCPEHAICEVDRPIGVVEKGFVGDIGFVQGRLKVGEAMSPPLIAAVKRHFVDKGVTIIDSPPGTSCPVIEAVRGCDMVVLVTEPTPFGLADLVLAVGAVREMQIPFGVVVNRADVGDSRVSDYCDLEKIPVFLEIPNDRRVAECYSRGQTIVDGLPEMSVLFEDLFSAILKHHSGLSSKNGGSLLVPDVPGKQAVQR